MRKKGVKNTPRLLVTSTVQVPINIDLDKWCELNTLQSKGAD